MDIEPIRRVVRKSDSYENNHPLVRVSAAKEAVNRHVIYF